MTGLRYTFRQTLNPKLRAMLRLDPFATPIASKADTPRPEIAKAKAFIGSR